jgi:hypothetical protein
MVPESSRIADWRTGCFSAAATLLGDRRETAADGLA